MVITQKDVNDDLHMLVQSMERENRPLASAKKALKLSMFWPMSCVTGYALAMIWTVYQFKPQKDNFDNLTTLTGEYGFAFAAVAVSIFFAMVISAIFYGPMLAYLSLDENVRKNSLIISRVKESVLKMGVFFIAINIILAICSIFRPEFLAASPFVLMISFIIMQCVISAEFTRYGIASVMSKLSKLVKKI